MSSFRVQLQEQITAQVIAKLESGVSPWEFPWMKTGCGGLPVNFKTMARYNGVNVLILWFETDRMGWSSNAWLTFKQAQELGGHVRKGEKGTNCVFYKLMATEADREGDGAQRTIPCLKSFSLFNLDQIEGIDRPVLPDNLPEPGTLEARADDLLLPYLQQEGINVRHGGDRAFYSPVADYIRLPMRGQFKSVEQYISTLAHECFHSTGHRSRLDRFSLEEFDTRHQNYAIEELKAAMFEAMFCAMLKIDTELGSHASYIGAWLEHLHNDWSLILRAAAAASKGLDYIEAFGSSQYCEEEAA